MLQLDQSMEVLKMSHPHFLFTNAKNFYDMDTFNAGEATRAHLLMLDILADMHPSLVTLPMVWDFTVP